MKRLPRYVEEEGISHRLSSTPFMLPFMLIDWLYPNFAAPNATSPTLINSFVPILALGFSILGFVRMV